ncbi:MAG: phosphodiester glycosidase family protein [Fimbriimonadales bacterium]|nr:phosphodiester glycosidase family protein [Fimbriimonadales bacterium]
MLRFRLCLSVGCGLALWLFGFAWHQPSVEKIEKRISPHVVFFQEISQEPPLAIQGIRITPGRAVSFRAVLGNDVVSGEGALRGRELTSRMAWRHRALAAINADFFEGGDPLGLCIVNGELVSEPFPGRPAVGWTSTGQVVMGDALLDADLTRPDGAKHPITGLNRAAKPEGDLVLYTSFYGASVSAGQGVAVVLEALPRPLRVGTQAQALVREVRLGNSVAIPPTGGVLVGTGSTAEFLRALQPNDRVVIRVDLQGEQAGRWRAVQEAVAGGPWLIRNGKILTPAEQGGGFNRQTFVERRHPRTAVGRTANGEVLWLTVDGRQAHSQGVSLPELAQIMARYGAVEAINLDGGGSTTLVVRNLVVNSPSDGVERPVSNAWLVYDHALRPMLPRNANYQIEPSRATLKVGEQVRFRVKCDDQPISTWEVIWGSNSVGFIDQWGRFHALRVGRGVVSAYVDGQWLHALVEVVEATPNGNSGDGNQGVSKPSGSGGS